MSSPFSYQQKTTPEGTVSYGAAPRANPVALDTKLISSGLEKIGEGFRTQEEIVDLSRRSKFISDANLYWRKKLVEDYQTTDNPAGLSENIIRSFDEYHAKSVQEETDPRSRLFIDRHMFQLREYLANSSLSLQEKAVKSERDKNLNDAFSNYDSMLRGGQIDLRSARTDMLSSIANSGYDPVERNARAQEYEKKLSDAWIMGRIYNDPSNVKKALSASFGQTPQSMLSGIPPESIETLRSKIAYNLSGKNRSERPQEYIPLMAAHAVQSINPNWSIEVHSGGGEYGSDRHRAEHGYKAADIYIVDENGDKVSYKRNKKEVLALYEKFAEAGFKGIGFYGDNPSIHLDDVRANEWGPDTTKKTLPPDVKAAIERGRSVSRGGMEGRQISHIDEDMNIALKTMDAHKVSQYINFSSGMESKNMAQSRANVEGIIANHNAVFANGGTVESPLNRDAFTVSYGEIEGQKRYEAYVGAMQLGSDIQNLKTLPIQQQQIIINSSVPNQSDPDYAQKIQRHNILLDAANKVNAERKEDPMGWALNNGVFNASKLSSSSPADFAESISSRIGVAKALRDTYSPDGPGAPLSILTKQEASSLAAGIASMPVKDKISYLGALSARLTDTNDYLSIMKQIAPDSPVSSFAGAILRKEKIVTQNAGWFSSEESVQTRNIAATILEGESILNPKNRDNKNNGYSSGFRMPKDDEMREYFYKYVRNSIRNTDAADYIYQAVNAYYAGKAARIGDISGEFNQSIYDEALKLVIGGKSNPTGAEDGDVLNPWGMDDLSFQNNVSAEFRKKMVESGYIGSQFDDLKLYRLDMSGDGKYLLSVGSDYLHDKTGRLIELNVNPPETAMGNIGSSNYRLSAPPVTKFDKEATGKGIPKR